MVEELREHLISYSGVRDMDKYVFSNFKRLAIYFKALKLVSNIRKSIEVRNSKFCDKAETDSLHEISLICRNFEVELQKSFSFLSVLVDYYNEATYFSKEEWNNMLDIIELCLEGTPDLINLKRYKDYLQSRLKFYSLISNIQAVESCNKLLTQINLTL